MTSHKLSKNLCSTFARCSFIALAAVTLILASTAAYACGNPGGSKSLVPANIPLTIRAGASASEATGGSIVGLWHVTYTAGGQLFYDAFDQWRGDGTEFEIANVPPITGNVCMGQWKKVGSTIQLNHVGWGFDGNGNPIGMFTLTEKNTVSDDGSSYQGTFVYKAYDLNGNVIQEVSGTLAATRMVN